MPNPKSQDRFSFDPENPARSVLAVISKRQGEHEAIRIEEIVNQAWPGRWYSSSADSKGWATYPHRAKLQRKIKSIVRELRRKGQKIGSSRGSHGAPAGYYVITTGSELAKSVAPILRQAIDELHTVEALTGKNFYTAELAGQGRLFASEADGQSAVGRSAESLKGKG